MNVVLVFTFLLAFAMKATTTEWSGYIEDSNCAKKNPRTTADADHEACAKRCILKNGDKAILLTSDEKIYQITNQDKVMDAVGLKVTLEGQLDGDSITVTKVTH
jgi:hypothetical protein